MVHPWIFTSSIKSVEGTPEAGAIVTVHDAAGSFVGYGHFSPESSIRIRLLSTDRGKYPDAEWFRQKIRKAVAHRIPLPGKSICSDSCRLVFGESDGLPGLVIDKYGKYLAAQFLTCGMDRMKSEIAEFAIEASGADALIDRSDCELRKLEGLSDSKAFSSGAAIPPDLLISENNFKFKVSLAEGQKTGFFLDQRDNRRAAASFIRPGMSVLDCFSYTGAFSINAAGAGAESLTLLDESQPALDIAEENFKINGMESAKREYFNGSAFKVLREFRDRNMSFDFIILDPPKFAPTKASIDRASRAYKDVNLLAMKLLKPEGLVATFSCSSGIDRAKFREILCWAAEDSGKDFQIVHSFTQPCDHPVALNFPESEYLKGFLLRLV
ncbi:MAG: hypothetical protein A2X45_03170 [Lentisphaerae bacterium GWF2_50_93]|nr:MAG: hypothetical protein A2X45_03170 [Lentisphaerae bacterium GWF2_50_93]